VTVRLFKFDRGGARGDHQPNAIDAENHMKNALSADIAAPYCEIDDFIQAMGRAVTGVGIVATDGPAGRFGITVSSMASVSAHPPMLLVCLRADSPSAAAVEANGRFSLNLLHSAQAPLADAFAGRPRSGNAYDFRDPAWRDEPCGLPRVSDASATFVCDLESAQVAGSHLIVVGRVTSCYHEAQPPLLYCARRYGAPTTL